MTPKKYAPACKCCNGLGWREVWVIDGWSATECLCADGWTFTDESGWQAPANMVAQAKAAGIEVIEITK